MILVIGNKRFSSWSLRPWLLLKQFEIPFEEKLILLDQPDTRAEIMKFSEAGKVPVLVDGNIRIWESMAIAEYLNEKHPEKKMWPVDATARALARSISNEMHSGFSKMREVMSHDLQKNIPGFDYSKAADDVWRVQKIWTDCLQISKGPFLFGDFSIADAMFAPVVNRFITYDVKSENLIQNYILAVRNLPAHQEWIKAGLQETYEARFH
jgi:glutathione S-transferase